MIEPYYHDPFVTIYNGDNREVMPQLQGITAVVTDPPYGFSFMGKDWDHGVPGRHFWELIRAACLPGAPLLAFGGTRTSHRLTAAIEDAGWEIRDCLMWIYGSGFPKSLDVSKAIDKEAGAEREVLATETRYNEPSGIVNAGRGAESRTLIERNITAPTTEAARAWDGWGTALKPAYEPICLAMNPLDGTFAHNATTHGVAGINVDGGRIPSEDVTGWGGGGIWGKCDKGDPRPTQGRWPANVIHDGSEEATAGFPSSSSSSYRPPDKGGTGNLYTIPHAEGAHRGHNDDGSNARFFYTAKASSSERLDSRHPTVKPLALMKYLLTLVTYPERNLVLDPFSGSGATLQAAKELGLHSIGIELDESHCQDAANRLTQEMLPL